MSKGLKVPEISMNFVAFLIVIAIAILLIVLFLLPPTRGALEWIIGALAGRFG